MTTFAFPITLFDSEVLVVEAALKLLIEECDRKIQIGETTPFYSYRISAKLLNRKLRNEIYQSSGNTLLTPPDIAVTKANQEPKNKE